MITLLGHDVAHRVTGTGPVDVVLVHGIGVSSRYFAPLADRLARDARVVLPDLPGFGGSPRPDAPLTIAEHADVVLALADALGLRRPVLVGHSMGAQVVTEAAVRAPDAVGGVVLLGPVADPRAGAVGQGLRLLRDVAHEPVAWTLRQLREYLRCGPRWYHATLPHMLGYPTAERLAQVRVPVTLVRGRRDPVATARFVDDLAAAVERGGAGGVDGGAGGGVVGGGRLVERVVVPRGHLAQVNGAQAVADAALRLAARRGA